LKNIDGFREEQGNHSPTWSQRSFFIFGPVTRTKTFGSAPIPEFAREAYCIVAVRISRRAGEKKEQRKSVGYGKERVRSSDTEWIRGRNERKHRIGHMKGRCVPQNNGLDPPMFY